MILTFFLILGIAYWGFNMHQCSTKRFGGVAAFSYNGVCYVKYQTDDGITWDGAEHACEQHGGTLASISFATEWGKLLANLNLPDDRCYWIGLHSPNQDGTYVWIDGSPTGFVNWAIGEPSSTVKGNLVQSCVLMHSKKMGGLWSDEFCVNTTCDGAPVGYICEYKRY
jgi:hypothetical protein